MKKSKNIIFIISLIIALCIFVGYILLQNKNNITYIATIKSIDGDTIYVQEIEGKNNKARIGYCYFLIENIKMLDEDNKRIGIEDLNIGDTIIIIVRPGILTQTYPAHIEDIVQIKVVYNSAN